MVPHRQADTLVVPPALTASRGDLITAGWTPGGIARAVREGRLIRARNGVYLDPSEHADIHTAAHVGGRLTCVSELARQGVFVLERSAVHVYLAPNASRLRESSTRVVRHWGVLARAPHPRACSVENLDALIHAVRCQTPRAAVATVDSALRCGVLYQDEVDELFARLPRRYRVLRTLIDPRAESGPESLMRLMLRRLGCRFEVQVRIEGVGRVDFLVEGWLIIECDSEAHHSGWDNRRRDLRRDQIAAAAGFCTFRPIAEDIMWNPDEVWSALRGLVRRHVASEFRRNRPGTGSGRG